MLITYLNNNQNNTLYRKKYVIIKVNINDKVKFYNLKISEEYTKPPLRYNEAGLVKYLEKNGIGRPSTYSSIISKVIERDYVKIQNKSMLRDMKNKALINTDIEQLKSYRDKKAMMQNMHQAIIEINNTKQEISEIKEILKLLLAERK